MPNAKYRGRTAQVILPDPKVLREWADRAKAARLSLSSWMFEIIEASKDSSTDEDRRLNIRALEALREENRTLRREKEGACAELERQKTELFKLRNMAFLSKNGEYQIERQIVDALRRGGVWTDRELLKELEIDSKDVDALRLAIAQLQHLADYGLVEETVTGWRWVK